MSLDVFDVSGQKILITGAGRGIGKGVALAFAEAGADVAVSALTETGVRQVVSEIDSFGVKGLALTGDAPTSAEMDDIVSETLKEFGQIDTLVNCVGAAIRKPVVQLTGSDVEGMTDDEWHFIVDINLTEAFQGCRAIGRHMLDRRQGNVINISGWAAFRGRPQSAAYDASKAGVMRLTECLAQEWAPFGVRVNSIAPGSFPDPDQMSSAEYQARDDGAKIQVPLGRVGRLKEIGYLSVFLASPAAAYVTGQTWGVDGGISVKHP